MRRWVEWDFVFLYCNTGRPCEIIPKVSMYDAPSLGLNLESLSMSAKPA